MNLSKQCQKVYDYIKAHPGCTTLDIINATAVAYPSRRIAELRRAGVPIIVVGDMKIPGARPFKRLALRQASLDTLPIPGLLPSESP
ncbi:MAG: helix-turn-helix domain-containing protein [Xanthobacteraceae bacterium]